MQIERQTTGLTVGLKTVPRGEVNSFRSSGKRIGKWILVLTKWKDEALLIRRLSNVSSIGKEEEHRFLISLNTKLDTIIRFQIEELTAILQAMLYDMKFLKDARIANRDHLKLAKSQMKRIAKDYQLIKEKILGEVIKGYPLQFI